MRAVARSVGARDTGRRGVGARTRVVWLCSVSMSPSARRMRGPRGWFCGRGRGFARGSSGGDRVPGVVPAGGDVVADQVGQWPVDGPVEAGVDGTRVTVDP